MKSLICSLARSYCSGIVRIFGGEEVGLVLRSYGNTHHSKAPQSISIFVPIPLLLVQELAGQAAHEQG